MTNLDSILKSRDITLPTNVCLVKSMVLPHGDRPAVGKTGDPTRARASAPERVGAAGGRSRELPLVQHATAAADRRRRNGQRIGTAAGPGSETHQGAAPGSGRRRAD